MLMTWNFTTQYSKIRARGLEFWVANEIGVFENSVYKNPPSLMKPYFDETEFDENFDSYAINTNKW